MEAKYKPRIIEGKIKDSLSAAGCIVIEGVRDCGKTTTAEKFAKTTYRLFSNDPKNETIAVEPTLVLSGETPILIDEWHNVPILWDKVRREVDDRRTTAQFILTGSTAPEYSANRHSGAGRMIIVKMSPMSLCESGIGSKEVDFKNLFKKNNEKIFGNKEFSLTDYAKYIVIGGWPSNLNLNEKDSSNRIKSYIENLSDVDLRNVSQKISKQRVISLIRAISRNISTSSSMENIAKESQISPNTLRVYLDQLMRVYLLDELEAWSPHIRAKSRLRVKPKWAFCDPSIATASLGITSNHLINDREAFGLFFESLVLRDIRVLASSVDGAVYYISDSRNDRGNEIDIIVEMWDGRWAAFEVKLGSPSGIKDAVRNFEWLDNIISDTKREKLMSKNIIIAGGTSYTREDGINVISLAHLFA